MNRILKWLKTKPAKIALAVCAAAAVLAAVFFLQPGPGETESPAAGPVSETALLSQQAQGMLPSIDVGAVLRQAQAESTHALPQTPSRAPSQAAPPTQAQAQPAPPQSSAAARTSTSATAATRPAPTAPASQPTTRTTAASTSTTTTTRTTSTPATKAQPTISIRCNTILSNMDRLTPTKKDCVPANGILLPTKAVSFIEGESVFDLLKRVAQSEKIHLDFENNPLYNSAYVAAIGNLYERDCGELSGWMYRVNGVFPNYGSSKYILKQGDVVEWLYTCDLGKDIGGEGISQRG